MTELAALESVLQDSLNRQQQQANFSQALAGLGQHFGANAPVFDPISFNNALQPQPQPQPLGFVNGQAGVSNPATVSSANDMFQQTLLDMFRPVNSAAGPSTSNGTVGAGANTSVPLQAAPPTSSTAPAHMHLGANGQEIWDLTGMSSPSPPVMSAAPPAATATATATDPIINTTAVSAPIVSSDLPSSPVKAASPTKQPSSPKVRPGPKPVHSSLLYPFCSNVGVRSPAPPRQSIFRVVPSTKGKLPRTRLPTQADAAKIPNGTDSSTFTRKSVAKRSAEANDYMDDIRFQLAPAQLQNNNKPGRIFGKLRRRVQADGSLVAQFSPSPEELGSILQALYERASESYLRIMADSRDYTATIIYWIKLFRKEPDAWEPAIGPLVRMLSRTDMPINYMQENKIGGKVKALVEQVEEMRLRTAPSIRRAYEQYVKYCQKTLFPKKRILESSDSESDVPIAKKRRTDAPSRTTGMPGSGSANAASRLGQSKPAASTSARPMGSKPGGPRSTDMSFFGAPAKPKVPLPSFTKRPAPPPAAVPSGTSLLASTLKKLKKEESPPVRSPRDVKPALPFGTRQTGPKLNKKGHTVKWVDLVAAPPRDFLAIRQFTQEPHEFERAPWQEEADVHGMSAHALDRQEGAAMRHHDGIEEVIDWYEPSPYDAGPEEAGRSFAPTEEAQQQEQRERAILAAPYVPGETQETGSESGVKVVRQDSNTRMMNTVRVYNVAQPATAPAAPAVAPSISDLLDNLSGINLPIIQPAGYTPSAPAAAPAPAYGQQYGQAYNAQPSQSPYDQQYSSQGYNSNAGYNANSGYKPSSSSYGSGYNNNNGNSNNAPRWNNNSNQYQNRGQNNWRGNPHGRGGHGGGHGGPVHRATRTCHFWLRGRCDDGDACKFRHEN